MPKLFGHISQIIGPVVDVFFDLSEKDEHKLPAIHDALSIDRGDGKQLIVEIQQHIG
ncbi:MAG: F0F1 ATP synthase subunit beta, partial [Paludibacter sp.]